MSATTEKLNQAEAVLHSLTGSAGADELQPRHGSGCRQCGELFGTHDFSTNV